MREKIDFVLHQVMSLEQVPAKFFKHLEEGIYEIRVKVGGDIYRVFCFFEKGRLVILLNGFQKKSQKTPKNELERAKRLREQYYADRESKNYK
ncbi:type II toxin-antitoxin system RelE/ParE family toxin [soil metagenome]